MSSLSKIAIAVLFLSLMSCGMFNKQSIDKETFINYEAIKKYPRPIAFVSDYESLFTIEENAQLNSRIERYSKQTGNQIAIVTVSSIEPYETLKDFTTDLGNYWGVGQKGIDNGLIITVSKKMRNIWIGSGLGIEEVLTDEILQDIINRKIIPYFRKGEYYKGVNIGLDECIAKWNSEH